LCIGVAVVVSTDRLDPEWRWTSNPDGRLRRWCRGGRRLYFIGALAKTGCGFSCVGIAVRQLKFGRAADGERSKSYCGNEAHGIPPIPGTNQGRA
jgi:hypothetical protein